VVLIAEEASIRAVDSDADEGGLSGVDVNHLDVVHRRVLSDGVALVLPALAGDGALGL